MTRSYLVVLKKNSYIQSVAGVKMGLFGDLVLYSSATLSVHFLCTSPYSCPGFPYR